MATDTVPNVTAPVPATLVADQKPAADQHHTLIIGPSGSGKTWLISALEVASVECKAFKYFPINPEMRNLHQLALKAIETGVLDVKSSEYTTEFTFKFEERGTRVAPETKPQSFVAGLLSPRKSQRDASEPVTYYFTLLDGPGESTFPEGSENRDDKRMAEYRDKLVEMGRSSRGLILCIDSSDLQKTGVVVQTLSTILSEIQEGRERPFEHVAIVLTKADKHFIQYGTLAESKAENSPPWSHARVLLLRFGLRRLLDYLGGQKTRIACGWASVFGFIDGAANYDPQRGGLLTYDKAHKQSFDDWRPYRLLDPFFFVATGELGTLTEFSEDVFTDEREKAPRKPSAK